jgi:peptide/nickel transport system ATP-binding protein
VTLELRAMTVRYGEGRKSLTAVDGIDLAIPRGTTVGLVGESGCGKSSVARAIVALAPLTSGRIFLDAEDVTSTRRRNSIAFRRRVQMVFQDPYSSLNPRLSVGEMLDEVMLRDRLRTGAARRAEALRILDLVGLPSNSLRRYAFQFSGGQRQRIAIGRALAVAPEVIINDEVTSSLDVSVQATILNLLRDLQKELGLTYLFISHDLSTVRLMSEIVAVMYLGRIVETAPTDQLFGAPQHPYTRALIASVPEVGAKRRSAPVVGELPDPRSPPPGCRFHTRCPIGPLVRPEREICREEDPQPGSARRPHSAACHFAAALVAEREALATTP